MAGSETAGGAAGPSPLLLRAGLAFAVAAALYAFPPFRIVRLPPPAAAGAAPLASSAPTAFDAAAAAGKFWQQDLPAAAGRAVELKELAPAIRAHAERARTQFGKTAGLGATYYFVRGTGRIVARERNVVHVAPDGAPSELIALRLGPVFGNVVRDGTGLLDVNAFPGLQEFNDLSAALNALVEKLVLPSLRERAVVGATVSFAGCAEAPESAPDAGEPLLTVVPVQADVRG